MAYLLFAWINAINSDQKVEEYFTTYLESRSIVKTLEDPNLYELGIDYKTLDSLATSELSITLYKPNGYILYSSLPSKKTRQYITLESLYKNLYELQQGYRVYTLKQPVFEGDETVGYFEIDFAREKWMTKVSNRMQLVIGLFILFFIVIYLIVIRLVNKKFNVRIKELMKEMTDFAQGKNVVETKSTSDEIGELKDRFYIMRRQLIEAQKVIDQEQLDKEYMIATISHDLKTPLTSIKAYAEMLERKSTLTEAEKSAYHDVIVEKSDFMKTMLDDLLMYTILQSSTYQLELVEVDGEEFFDMLVSGYNSLCFAKELTLTSESHVEGSYLLNPKQIIRVADNLMMNAIQHTKKGGNVWLAAVSKVTDLPDWLYYFAQTEYRFEFGAYSYLIVQNDGLGVKKELIEQVFNPLFQADQARTKSEAHGTGLGLSITKQIMEKHNGEVRFMSDESIGTTIICKIPRKVECV